MVFYASFHAFNQWYLRVLVVDFRGFVQTSWNSWHLLDFTPPSSWKDTLKLQKLGRAFFFFGGGGTQIILLMVQKTQTTNVWMFKHEINCQPQLVLLAGFLPSTVCMVEYFFPPFFTSEKWYGTRNCQLGSKIASWVDGTVFVMTYLGPGILHGHFRLHTTLASGEHPASIKIWYDLIKCNVTWRASLSEKFQFKMI